MRFAYIIAAAGLAASPALADESACPSAPSRYAVSYEGDGVFTIEAQFPRTSGQFDIYEVSDTKGRGATSDFIRDVAEAVPGGERPLSYAGDGAWKRAEGQTETPVTIRYRLVAGHDGYSWPNGKEEVAYRFDDAFYFVGMRALLADLSLQNCPAEVAFDLPDWDVAAPWPTEDGRAFHPASVDQLLFNGFAVGPDIKTFRSTFGKEGEVTFVYAEAVGDVARLAAADMDRIVNRYAGIFGGAPGDSFMIFMTDDLGNDGGAYRNSFAMRFKTPVRPSDGLVWRFGFAHETLHLWIGRRIRPADDDIEWFKEGFTDYLAAKALYAEGIISGGDYQRKIETMIRRYVLALAMSGPKPLADASRDKGANRLLVYGGGAMAALLLDAEMSAEKGPGAFEAMLAGLYEKSSEPYTLDRLMEALDAHSGGRASEILAETGSGTDPFALADRLEPHGIALSVFAPEEMYVAFLGEGCRKRREPCPPAFLRLP
jgi:predicted metalloprotease with PDZ domain